ncbi:hypothetical protein CALVIDRAFT_540455 [Calocera viscosa TUFC12733]|uniref:C2 NT-type domain-containing protein n=1 Tax=Calocera viscosa (strain TUFC12733) TaxID=1330018 RepID=A0A167IV15_CALVF|nr:hypothetical protein CALVIDRAFT_540455 [Calocera viscosa TUFC12733]
MSTSSPASIPATMISTQKPAPKEQSSTSKYVCRAITVDGLPTRSTLKSEAKYFVKVTVAGGEGWKSREFRTRGSQVVWDGEEDRHKFECTPASVLRLALYKNHKPPKPVEELGTAELSVDGWLGATLGATRTLRLRSITNCTFISDSACFNLLEQGQGIHPPTTVSSVR